MKKVEFGNEEDTLKELASKYRHALEVACEYIEEKTGLGCPVEGGLKPDFTSYCNKKLLDYCDNGITPNWNKNCWQEYFLKECDK